MTTTTPIPPAESPQPTKSAEPRGRADAERVRQATQGPKRRGRKPSKPVEAVALTTPEEREFWGRQMQGFWNGLSAARGYPTIPDDQVSAIGEPAALTAKKYLSDAQEEHPEYLLLFVLTPYIMGAIRVEWQRWAQRPAGRADTRGERGGPGTEGQRENNAGAADAATAPFQGPSN